MTNIITVFQLTDPDFATEYTTTALSESAAEVGDLVSRGTDLEKRFEVVQLYPYEPIVLGAEYRINLAIVHPIDAPALDPEEWYAWQNKPYCPHQCLHILMHQSRIIRNEECSGGQSPLVGSPVKNFRARGRFYKIKLDTQSVAIELGQAKALPPRLRIESHQKHLSPDSPYSAIYLVSTVAEPALQVA